MRDMLGRGEAVSVKEALALILKNLPDSTPSEENLPIEASYHRVLSRDIVSPEDLPGFPRSTMDGYAVSSADTFGASETSPAYLSVEREILMGVDPGFRLKPAEAAKISTGGMLPDGADAVLMLEHAREIDKNNIEAFRAVAPGENVIGRGEDLKRGELVLARGRRLRAEDMAVLAGLGMTEVSVYARPRVSIISTGDEVVPPGAPLKPGMVRDMNSYNLVGLISAEGAVPLMKGIVRDDYGLIRGAVESSLRDSDMVLISGGSSVGQRDMTEKVVAELGRVIFHSVSIKPGKPLIAGVADGARTIPVFGLPGHPRAVSVCFETFILPALRRLSGAGAYAPFWGPHDPSFEEKTVAAKLAKTVHSAAGRQEHICVALEDRDGELWAVPMLGKSGLITTLVRADGTVIIPNDKLGIEKGETVPVQLKK